MDCYACCQPLLEDEVAYKRACCEALLHRRCVQRRDLERSRCCGEYTDVNLPMLFIPIAQRSQPCPEMILIEDHSDNEEGAPIAIKGVYEPLVNALAIFESFL